MRLSARALGVLGVMVRDTSLTSAEKLSEAVLEGQAAILTALKELERAGLIERGKNRIDGRIIAYTRVSEKGRDYYFGTLPSLGFRGTVIEGYIEPPKPYSHYNHNTNTPILLVNIPEQSSGEGEEVPYDFFKPTSSNDDQIAEKVRWEREKSRIDRPKKLPRQQMPRLAWSCADVVDYFIDAMESNYDIAGFTISKRRFIPALSGKRKAFGTNGEIECIMVDLFFESIQHERFSNGASLWGNFLNRFADFDQLARASITDPEKEMAAQAVADKSWEWMEE